MFQKLNLEVTDSSVWKRMTERETIYLSLNEKIIRLLFDIMKFKSLFEKYKYDIAFVESSKVITYLELLSHYFEVERNIKRHIGSEKNIALIGPMGIEMVISLCVLLDNNCIVTIINSNEKDVEGKLRITQSNIIIYVYKEKIIFKKQECQSMPKLTKRLVEQTHAGFIIFSSGTTGESKAALHDWNRFAKKYKNYKQRKERMLLFLAIDHVGGLNTLFHGLFSGTSLVIPKSQDIHSICKLIECTKVEILPTTPTFINMLLFTQLYNRYDLSSLKIITYGTEVMHPSTLKLANKIFENVIFKQTYGLSELGIMSTRTKENSSLYMKIGGEGFQIKIEDNLLYIKSNYSMVGYLNAESPFDEEGWYNTKDIVDINEEGYLRIIGRNTDIININGVKCNILEIENTINQMDNIIDCVVLLRNHKLLGNYLEAKVVIDKDVSLEDFERKFYRYCYANLPKNLIPAKICYEKENLAGYRWKKSRL